MRTSRELLRALCPGGAVGAGVLLVGAAVGAMLVQHHPAEGAAVRVPAPASDVPADVAPSGAPQIAVLSGGCFWGVQGVFQHVAGVQKVVSGYSGGEVASPDYEMVSTGATGHAESVQITYDPHQISYGRILQIFFSVALDPTQLNYQGPDHGTQYRSEVFAANADQQRVAQAYIGQLGAAHVFAQPIVTRVDPLAAFYPAEDYHQDYLTLHPNQPYIAYNDMPKVENLKRLFPELYRGTPVLTRPSGSSS